MYLHTLRGSGSLLPMLIANRLLETKDGGDSIAEIKRGIDAFMSAHEEFKKTNDLRIKQIEARGAADPVTEEKLRKIEADLAKAEDLNQKLTAVQAEQKKAADDAVDLEGRLTEMEKKLGRPGAGGFDPELRKAEMKQQANLWLRGVVAAHIKGVVNLPEDQRQVIEQADAEYKSLGITDDTGGGYLAPSQYVNEIIKSVTEMSAVRTLVRVRQTGAKSIMLPKRTGQFAAQRVVDQGTRSETTGLAYGMVEIVAPEMFALIDISNQNLEDSAFDLQAEVSGEAVEQFAVKEGQEVIAGSGVGECEGVLTNTSIGFNTSGSATAIADANGGADGVLGLFYSIKTAYARNGSWGLNRTTLGSVRRLKDKNNQYLWMPGIANGQPNTINGAPYVELPDMPNEGAGLYPIAFGDWNRGYTLLDRVSMTMLRDPFTQATSGNVRFLFRRRVGGAVTQAEAIRKLKCST